MKSLYLILLSVFIISCDSITGEEIARLPINKVSTGEDKLFEEEAVLDLKKGDKISFWSDIDLEYKDELFFGFRIRVWKNNVPYGIIEFESTDKNITIGEFKTNINGKTKWSFTGKNSEMEIKEDAKYKFRGIFKTSTNESLVVNKAELIIKK